MSNCVREEPTSTGNEDKTNSTCTVNGIKQPPLDKTRKLFKGNEELNGIEMEGNHENDLENVKNRKLVIRIKAPKRSGKVTGMSPVSSVTSGGSQDAKEVEFEEYENEKLNEPVGEQRNVGEEEESYKDNGGKNKRDKQISKKKGSTKTSNTKKSYLAMIKSALVEMKEKQGSSLIAIRKYIAANNRIKGTGARFKHHFSLTLKKAVDDKIVIRNGARYKLSEKTRKQMGRIRQKVTGSKSSANKGGNDKQNTKKLTAEQLKIRKRKLEKLRKEREIKSYRASLSKAPVTCADTPIPNLHMADIFAVCEFCNHFAKPLKLAPFTATMFYKALTHDSVTFLVREVHFAFLDMLLRESANRAITRFGWENVLNVITWQEILRRYLILVLHNLGSAYPDYREIQIAINKLAEKGYFSMTIRSKIAILRVLLDDLLELEPIMNLIEINLETRSEITKNKWKEEQEARERIKELKRKCEEMDETGKKKKGKKVGKKKKENEKKKKQVKKSMQTSMTLSKKAKENEDTESESYESEKEQIPISKRQRKAILQASEREIAELERRIREKAKEYMRKRFDVPVRAEPLGYDSMNNSFWLFRTDRKRLYIFGYGLRGEKRFKSSRWRFYNSKIEIDQLITSLDKHNNREKYLMRRLKTFYERITKKLPKEKEVNKTKAEDKGGASPKGLCVGNLNAVLRVMKDESINIIEDHPLLQKIRPQRNSARRAQEAIRDTSISATNRPHDENVDKCKILQREQTLAKQEDDPNAFITYRNYESLHTEESLLTMVTERGSDLRWVENGDNPELITSWLVAEVRAIAQTINESGGRFSDFRLFSSSIDEIFRIYEGYGFTKFPKKARQKLEDVLLFLEDVAVNIIVDLNKNEVGKSESGSENQRRQSNKKPEILSANGIPDELYMFHKKADKELKKLVEKFKEGTMVLCEVYLPKERVDSKMKPLSAKELDKGKDMKEAVPTKKKDTFIEEEEDPDDEKGNLKSNAEAPGASDGEPENDEKATYDKHRPGYSLELMPGVIKGFRPAKFVDFEESFDGWEILLENQDTVYLDEEQVQEAINLFKASDVDETSELKQESETSDSNFPQAPLWKLKCKRESWLNDLENIRSLSAAALVVYMFSVQIVIIHADIFRRKKKPVEIHL